MKQPVMDKRCMRCSLKRTEEVPSTVAANNSLNKAPHPTGSLSGSACTRFILHVHLNRLQVFSRACDKEEKMLVSYLGS